MTSALIVEDKRVFGINGYQKSKTWHIHPLGEVKEPVKIEPMCLEDIMKEYAKVLYLKNQNEIFLERKALPTTFLPSVKTFS